MKIYRLLCTIWIILIALGFTCYGEEIQVITEHSPPGEYKDETGRVTGSTAEMVRELMHRLNLSGDIKSYPWKRAYMMLLSGPKVALFETTRTEERENLFKWVGPIKRVRWGFFAKKSSGIKINNLKDAKKGETICVYGGDAKGEYLKKQGFTNLYQPVRSIQCLKMLMLDRVTLWVASDLGIGPLFKEAGVDQSEVELVFEFGRKYLYIALSRDVPDEIVKSWQKTLDEMKIDGTVAKYYKGIYPDEIIQAISITKQPLFPWKTGKRELNSK